MPSALRLRCFRHVTPEAGNDTGCAGCAVGRLATPGLAAWTEAPRSPQASAAPQPSTVHVHVMALRSALSALPASPPPGVPQHSTHLPDPPRGKGDKGWHEGGVPNQTKPTYTQLPMANRRIVGRHALGSAIVGLIHFPLHYPSLSEELKYLYVIGTFTVDFLLGNTIAVFAH